MLPHLLRSLLQDKVVRYLVVGTWSTVVGYGIFAALTWLLTGLVPYAYMMAAVLDSVISITVAYLGHKLFVFQTKGNWLKEYLRCWTVYGASSLLGLALLPILVFLLSIATRGHGSTPYLAGAILNGGTIVINFLGHKGYTFAAQR